MHKSFIPATGFRMFIGGTFKLFALILGLMVILLGMPRIADAYQHTVTIYFGGTGLKSDDWKASESPFDSPALVSVLHECDDAADDLYPTHHKLFVDGVVVASQYQNRVNTGGAFLDDIMEDIEDDDTVILNIVGNSRGGITSIWFSSLVADGIWGKDSAGNRNDQITRINVLALDPVSGDDLAGGIYPNLGKNGRIGWTQFELRDRVTNYLGVYASDERSWEFAPLVPSHEPVKTRRVLLRVRGSHQTFVGSHKKAGHDPIINWLVPPWDLGYAKISSLEVIGDLTKTISAELLMSPQWGSVKFMESADHPTYPAEYPECVSIPTGTNRAIPPAGLVNDVGVMNTDPTLANYYVNYMRTRSFLPLFSSYRNGNCWSWPWFIFDVYPNNPRCLVVIDGGDWTGGCKKIDNSDEVDAYKCPLESQSRIPLIGDWPYSTWAAWEEIWDMGNEAPLSNEPPVADDQSLEFVEDLLDNPITLTASDPNGDTPLTFALVGGSGPDHGTLGGTVPKLTYTPDTDYFGPDSFQFTAADEYGATSLPATVSITVTPVNDDPLISISRVTATLQYSDTIGTVTITASDVDDDPLFLSAEYLDDLEPPIAGLPSALGVAGSCTSVPNATASPGTSCSWDLTGQMLEDAGSYLIAFTVTDGGGGTETILSATDVTEIVVTPENATISFDGDNPVAIQVNGDGSDASLPFSLTVYVVETEPDLAIFAAAPGDITLAVPHFVLTPVGPGGPQIPVSCDPPSTAGAGYAQEMTFTCNFAGVAVNTYSVDVTVDGGYYTGFNDDVFTVFDPSLGFTSGGGWFLWPLSGDRTNFGYTMKYNKKRTNVQGSLLVIRHIEGAPEGFDKWRIKSNALFGLALGEDGYPPYGWAAFNGKATYKSPGVDNQGNHELTVFVEDHGQPGSGVDQFWIQMRDKKDDVIPVMSMPFPGTGNTQTLEGGNIVVPHKGAGKGKRK